MKKTKGMVVLFMCLAICLILGTVAFSYESNNYVRKTVKTDEGKISYIIRNGKPKNNHTILFVHGAMENAMVFEPLARRFPDYNAIVIDLPAHGESEGVEKDTVKGYAEVVKQAVRKLENEGVITGDITVAGYSLGGSVAIEMALSDMPEISDIVMVSSSAKWILPEFVPNVVADRAATEQLMLSEFTPASTQESINYLKNNFDKILAEDSVRVADMKAAMSFDRVSDLKNLNIPVLMLVGDKDKLAVLPYQTQIKEQVKESYLTVYPNAGHNLLLERKALPTLEHSIREFFRYTK